MKSVKRIISNLVNPESLSQKVVAGGFWVFALRIIQRIFSFIRLVVLARLLSPHDFGLMGIALLTMGILETFSQTGLGEALIQKKGDVKRYLDSVWTLLVVRGFLLFVILLAAAPLAAHFFSAPEAQLIIQVLAFSILLGAFTNIGVIYFSRELEFRKEFTLQFAGTVADFVVAILAVLLLRNVWALVLGLLARNAACLVMSYVLHPYRPHFTVNFGRAQELLGFGRWILTSSILVFLLTHGDDIVVGRLLGVTLLGFYQMAYTISNAPATEISHLIARVTFPAYSLLQDNLPKLREAYVKVLHLTAFLTFPVTGLIFGLAPELTGVVLGEKWMPMVPAMQVLALYGGLRAIGATTGVVFMAVGKPEIMTKIEVIQLAVVTVLIYSLTMKWGITGASLAVTVYASISILAVFEVLRIVQSPWRDSLTLLIPLTGTLVMVSGIFALKTLEIHFFLRAGAGVMIYLGVMWISGKVLHYEGNLLIQEQIKSLLVHYREE